MPPLLSVLEIHPDLPCYLACDRKSHVRTKPVKIKKPHATHASALSPPSALHTKLPQAPKGCAGEAEAGAVHKSEPLQNIPDTSSPIPLRQGHLGRKGGLTLVTPVLPGILPPPKSMFEILQKIKAISIYDMMNESKELKTLCGTSYMLCMQKPLGILHRNVDYNYSTRTSLSAKVSALHLLSCHGKRAMRENRDCSRKGKKNSNLFRKAPSIFLQTIFFLGLSVGKNKHGSSTVSLLIDISDLAKGISALQFFEELK